MQRGADFHANAAAGTIFHVDFQRKPDVRIPARIDRRRLEAGRGVLEGRFVVVLGPDDAVRASQAALTTLNALVGFPNGNGLRNIALFKRGAAGGECTVDRELADTNLITAAGHHERGNLAHERRRRYRYDRRSLERARRRCGNGNFKEMFQCLVDGGEVHAHDVASLVAVALRD